MENNNIVLGEHPGEGEIGAIQWEAKAERELIPLLIAKRKIVTKNYNVEKQCTVEHLYQSSKRLRRDNGRRGEDYEENRFRFNTE